MKYQMQSPSKRINYILRIRIPYEAEFITKLAGIFMVNCFANIEKKKRNERIIEFKVCKLRTDRQFRTRNTKKKTNSFDDHLLGLSTYLLDS